MDKIIPLPSSDVYIPPNLLENDPPIHDPLIEPVKDNQPTPLTIPCSIDLQRLDARDITMWLPKPIANQTLPDATLGTSNTYPESKNKSLQFRDHERKVQPTPVRNRPERTVSKLVTYAEQTDDSSQDS